MEIHRNFGTKPTEFRRKGICLSWLTNCVACSGSIWPLEIRRFLSLPPQFSPCGNFLMNRKNIYWAQWIFDGFIRRKFFYYFQKCFFSSNNDKNTSLFKTSPKSPPPSLYNLAHHHVSSSTFSFLIIDFVNIDRILGFRQKKLVICEVDC